MSNKREYLIKAGDVDWTKPRVASIDMSEEIAAYERHFAKLFWRSDKGNLIKRYHRKKPRQGRWPKAKRRGIHAALRGGRMHRDPHFNCWMFNAEKCTGSIGGIPRADKVRELQDEINALRTEDRLHREVKYSRILIASPSTDEANYRMMMNAGYDMKPNGKP